MITPGETVQMPTAADIVSLGKAISVIDSGFMPFIPLSTQYKMGLTSKSVGFTVPIKTIDPGKRGEVGRAGKMQWAYMPLNIPPHSDEFAQRIKRYNEERDVKSSSIPGYSNMEEDGPQAFPEDAFKTKATRQTNPSDQLANDLRFTPDDTMAARSTQMAAELADIVQSFQADPLESSKEKAEMEEEGLLNMMESSEFPELNHIMKEAREQARAHGAFQQDSSLRTGKEGYISTETYDWGIKTEEDLTKMYALINIMNENMIGKKISNRVVGLEVTKDKKFLAKAFKGGAKGDYEGLTRQEQSEKFLEEADEYMAGQMKDMMNEIDKVYKKLGYGFYFSEVKGQVGESTLSGFTLQIIGRAREALLSPAAPGAKGKSANSFSFAFPMGGSNQGGPYIVNVEIMPEWQQTDIFIPIGGEPVKVSYIVGLNYNIGVIPMQEFGSSPKQSSMANMILKHVQAQKLLSVEQTAKFMVEGAIWAGTQQQVAADRHDQLGSRFLHDIGMKFAESYLAYATIAATMTNREISDALFGMIQDNLDNPSMHKGLSKIMEDAMNDSNQLTDEWKRKVGGYDWEVPEYVFAQKGGPWTGTKADGVAITPLIGSSSQADLINSLGSLKRKGGAASYTAKRLTPVDRYKAGKKSPPEILFGPQAHQAKNQRTWIQAAWNRFSSLSPSTEGFEDYSGDGVIRVRKSWINKSVNVYKPRADMRMRDFFQKQSRMVQYK
jgi:hypothetical protein